MPVAKEAVFEYFSFVIDLLANQEFLKANSRNIAPLVSALEKLHKALLELMRHPKLGKKLKLVSFLKKHFLLLPKKGSGNCGIKVTLAKTNFKGCAVIPCPLSLR